jgi:SPP1 gp7 family putative phage head morphogenesis protein
MGAGCTRCDAAPRDARVKIGVVAESYRARLAKLVGGRIRAAYTPLLAALPRLAAASVEARADSSTRRDASPVDEASRLARDAEREFGGGFAQQVRSEIKRAALNVSSKTKTDLRRKLDKHEDRRVNAVKLTDSPRLKPIIDGFAAENAALITGISPRLSSEVQALVVAGLTAGTPHERLARQIRDRLDVSANRAEMIAIDQVGKLDGQLSAQRAQDLGVTHFWWRSSNDERVRGNPDGKYPKANPSHFDRNGQRFAYGDPPKGRNGEPELPGTAINCRCFGEPDLSTIAGTQQPEGQEAGEGAAPARSVDDLEAEADRMVREVEEMLARQQAEIERMTAQPEPEPEPEPPSRETPLDDQWQEAQAQILAQQMATMDPLAVETALARHRRWKRAGKRAQR